MRKLWPWLLVAWLLAGFPAGAWGAFWLETTSYPANLVPQNGGLFFSDASDAPVKRIDLQDGRLVPLASRMGAPIRFCLRGDDLFWVETRPGSSGDCTGAQAVQILTGMFAGGLQTIELARGSNCGSGTHEIIARGDSLYWVTSTISPDTYRIEKVPLAGAAPSVIHNAGWNPITALAADETHLYWTEGRYPDPGVVKRLPLAGGPAEVVYAAPLPVSGVLAVQDGYVIFADMGSPNAYRLLKAPLAGGPVTTLAAGVSVARPPIAVDDTHVYMADGFRIKKVPVYGGPPETVVAADFGIKDLAVDGGELYWTEEPFCAVKKVGVDGGPLTLLDTGSGPAGPLQVSGGVVYTWIKPRSMKTGWRAASAWSNGPNRTA